MPWEANNHSPTQAAPAHRINVRRPDNTAAKMNSKPLAMGKTNAVKKGFRKSKEDMAQIVVR